MGISVYKYCYCDVCLDPTDAHHGDNAGEARRLAKSEGWTRVRRMDICPNCEAPPKRSTAHEEEGSDE